MLTLTANKDPMIDIVSIVVDAIADGLLPKVTMAEFQIQMAHLSGAAKEDYIQALWDEI